MHPFAALAGVKRYASASFFMLFPVLYANVSVAEFQYPDLIWKDLSGQMASLVAKSGGNKGQLSHLLEAFCRDSRQHDGADLQMQLQQVLPRLVHYQLPPECKDFSDYYVQTKQNVFANANSLKGLRE